MHRMHTFSVQHSGQQKHTAPSSVGSETGHYMPG